ncbi:hypothetical protein ACQQ2N_17990 [Dokdonella sp. MW10]|uniref:hypothetical protein n=1 Tax=Dokdonella sp. MW10 TaxID=2992926 RepID=UPI003F80196B
MGNEPDIGFRRLMPPYGAISSFSRMRGRPRNKRAPASTQNRGQVHLPDIRSEEPPGAGQMNLTPASDVPVLPRRQNAIAAPLTADLQLGEIH